MGANEMAEMKSGRRWPGEKRGFVVVVMMTRNRERQGQDRNR